MQKTMISGSAFLLNLFLIGCGTITPNHVRDNEASFDDSVPKQYDQSKGWLLYTSKDKKGIVTGGVITPNARDRYNALVADYKIQYKAMHHQELSNDKGITPWQDKWKNQLYIIDAQHLEAFGRLSQMEKDRVAPDSAWQKIKDSVTK